jgi:signal transduction histidine kinase
LTYQPFVALLIALFEIARQYALRTALTFLLISAIPLSMNTIDTVINTNAGIAGGAATMAVWFTLAALVWAAGRESRRGEVLARLREEKLTAQAEVALQAQRLRVARDLHDIVAHSVTLMVLQAAGARRLEGRDDVRLTQLLSSIEATGQQAMRELRQMLRVLRPGSSDWHEAERTSSATSMLDTRSASTQLKSLVEHVRLAGLSVDVTETGARLDEESEVIAYRVVQEALTNASKYAGPGSRCEVLIDRGSQGLSVQVTDDAGGTPGVAVGSSGLGLSGLRERITALGGTLNADATSDRPGYSLSAWIPRPTGDRGENWKPTPETLPTTQTPVDAQDRLDGA